MNIHENLKAYADGELSAVERETIEKALAEDAGLREELDEIKGISLSIQAMARQPEIKGYEQVRSTVAVPRGSLKVLWRTLGVVAVVSVLGAFLFPVFAQSKEAAKNTSHAYSATDSQADMRTMGGFEKRRSRAGEAEVGGLQEQAEKAKLEPSAPMVERPQASSTSADAAAYGTTMDRQIIKTGYLTVLVDELDLVSSQIEGMAKRYQGYVESSAINEPPSDRARRTADYTIRVKSDQFEQAMSEFEALGERISVNSNSADVSAEIVDVEARLKTMRAEEEQYLELLKSARKVGEVLEVKERLFRVRQEIESLDAQRKQLRGLASLSTINLTLWQKAKVEEPVPQDWTSETWTNAVITLQKAGRFLGRVGIYALVLSPIWLPIVAVVLWRRYRKV